MVGYPRMRGSGFGIKIRPIYVDGQIGRIWKRLGYVVDELARLRFAVRYMWYVVGLTETGQDKTG